jgi:hypothetical protein
MSFFALQIVCSNCGTVFLIGGGARNDLAPWRRLTVECRQCSAQVQTIDGVAIDLRALRTGLAGDGRGRRLLVPEAGVKAPPVGAIAPS